MKRHLLCRIWAIVMACLTLFISSLTIVVNTHFCRDELAGVSFFDEVEMCCDNGNSIQQVSACVQEEFRTKGCCRNETSIIDHNEILARGELPAFTSKEVFLTNASETSYLTRKTHPAGVSAYKYPPPLLNQDITVLFQTFLI